MDSKHMDSQSLETAKDFSAMRTGARIVLTCLSMQGRLNWRACNGVLDKSLIAATGESRANWRNSSGGEAGHNTGPPIQGPVSGGGAKKRRRPGIHAGEAGRGSPAWR